jgi:hypothetical protein
MMRYLRKIEGAGDKPINWKMHKARTVIGWFSKGIPNGRHLRSGLNDSTSIADVLRLLDGVLDMEAA